MMKTKKKVKNYLFLFFAILLIGIFSGCSQDDNEHVCISGGYTLVTIDATCLDEVTEEDRCIICDKLLDERKYLLEHDLNEEVIDATCNEEGKVIAKCNRCSYQTEETIAPYGHLEGEFATTDEVKCHYFVMWTKYCQRCNEVLSSFEEYVEHELYEKVTEATCDKQGKVETKCYNCDYLDTSTINKLGHEYSDYHIEREATLTSYGIKYKVCSRCMRNSDKVEYACNTYSTHGALSVNGRDLVNEEGKKVQLIGVSTHGIQWFSRVVTFETFEALKNEFGINVIRLALYTSEGGYCVSSEARKEQLYNLVVSGIEYATQLDMYVIVDWHMVGADDVKDKNPLTYVNESSEFFGRISKQFKDYNNIIYEIMNEPCGTTTWDDCKKYANQVIPRIRENTDAVILVGNPSWSADLESVMRSPLTGYQNIMYTYHFYAGDHKSVAQVEKAYDSGYPVFISEHGGMNSDGNGDINYSSIRNWYSVLDKRNISYVAWNLSNSGGDASILKASTTNLINFKDDNLKIWGRWYKTWTREKAGLPIYTRVNED